MFNLVSHGQKKPQTPVGIVQVRIEGATEEQVRRAAQEMGVTLTSGFHHNNGSPGVRAYGVYNRKLPI